MGLFTSILSKTTPILEVDKTVNGETETLGAGDANSTATDYSAGNDDAFNLPDEEEDTDAGEEEGTEQPAEGEQPEDATGTEGEGEDYGAGLDDALSFDDGDDAAGSTDTTDSSSSMDTPEPINKSELQNLEDELFSNLTPEQINIKHQELKQQYVELYTRLEEVIERLSNINKTEFTAPSINFVSKKIMDLREMINYYLITVYSTKTYTENTINYQHYLAVLNTINKILDQTANEKVKKR